MSSGNPNMSSELKDLLRLAALQDPSILVPRDQVDKSLGQDPRYLNDLGLEKRHLIRLERLGLALKARYQTTNKTGKSYFLDLDKQPIYVTGPQRVRWILFQEALS